jgi:hypothetical protein
VSPGLQFKRFWGSFCCGCSGGGGGEGGGGKVAEVCSWSFTTISCSEVKNACSYTSSVLYAFFHFKLSFLHPLILFFVFHTFLILNTSNKRYTLENGSIYLLLKFRNSALVFTQLSLGSFLNLFIFILNFSLWNNSFQTPTYVS